jgi:Uma2 family endonuclease
MTIKANRIERYYDTHEVEGEDVVQSIVHFAAIEYLITVLKWLFQGQVVGIISHVNFYQTDHAKEQPTSPDLAVVDGLVIENRTEKDNPSYYVGEDGPPPRVVFEVSSKETWKTDLSSKLTSYNALGVDEYFAFDPNPGGVWTREWREQGSLLGWKQDTNTNQYYELQKDPAGRLWSDQLQSWLVLEGQYLRLYTADGRLRLTEAEAERQQRLLEQARAEAERQQRLFEQARAEAERQQRLLEQAKTEAAERLAASEKTKVEAAERLAASERERAEAEKAKAAKLEEKLAELMRLLGKNPDELA